MPSLIIFIAIINDHLCDSYNHDDYLNYHPASLAHQVGMVSSPQNLGQDHFVSGKVVTYFFPKSKIFAITAFNIS